MMAERPRVACVGAGYFAQFHYDGWRRIEDVSLIGSVDQDIEKAKATGLNPYPSLDALLTDYVPDILDIITPPPTHSGLIERAISAGVKTVICQKPFCENLSEAEALSERAEASGTTIVVHENFRFQPWYRVIKQAISAGKVGSVQQVTFRLRPGDGQGPDAYWNRQPYFQKMPRFLFHETGVHFVDVFRFLLGDADAVFADIRTLNPVIVGEDAGHFLLSYADGKRALFDGNRHLDHAAENTRRTMGEALIEGTEGTLTLNGDGIVLLRRFGARDEEVVFTPQSHHELETFGGDCVHALQRHVVDHLLCGSPLENTSRDYLWVLKTVQAAYLSADKGCFIPLSSS